jgi:hypothetical protein
LLVQLDWIDQIDDSCVVTDSECHPVHCQGWLVLRPCIAAKASAGPDHGMDD